MLWIAFKLYIYWGLWQRLLIEGNVGIGCELLSNCIFTEVFDNKRNWTSKQLRVVNCFQIVYLLRSLTTGFRFIADDIWLWIAFKLYIYWGLWQHNLGHFESAKGCELLSNCIFTEVFDNLFRVNHKNSTAYQRLYKQKNGTFLPFFCLYSFVFLFVVSLK